MGDYAFREDGPSAEAGDEETDANTGDYDSGDYGGDFGGGVF